jgi:hypothetical protein
MGKPLAYELPERAAKGAHSRCAATVYRQLLHGQHDRCGVSETRI